MGAPVSIHGDHPQELSGGVQWNDGLEFLRQQCREDSMAWFPKTSDNLPFMILAMLGEAGEVANIVKKMMRGSNDLDNEVHEGFTVRDHLAEEIIDVLIYLCNIMGMEEFKDIDWMQVWYAKRAFNQRRFDKKDEL
jgi:NTP pyrophosphatase (non-canonical NTP hydrolase)